MGTYHESHEHVRRGAEVIRERIKWADHVAHDPRKVLTTNQAQKVSLSPAEIVTYSVIVTCGPMPVDLGNPCEVWRMCRFRVVQT